MIEVHIPPVFKGISKPYRYKVFYGGRGSGKSQSVARYLLLAGKEEPMRILCCREFQTSIKDSVKQLLEDLINELELDYFYKVLTTEIRGINGTSFVFAGLHHNVANIKSMHDVKKCWVEEAQVVSESSWDVLIPTIRADKSEIILTMNPELEEDPTYQRFITSPPENSLILKVNYNDNPYFNDVLRQEMESQKIKNYDKYLNIWEGNCKAAIEGAIFAKEMQKATEEGRITKVPYEKTKPVDVYFDLGRSDLTSLWFHQQIAYESRLLRYYENNGEHFSHYTKYLKDLPYTYGTFYLPHDAENELLSSEKTIKQQTYDAFPGVRVVIVPRIPQKTLAIDSARGMMDTCVWDKELCADGLTCLRKYHYRTNPDTGKISKEPEHDVHSNGADAFMAIGQSRLPVMKPKQPQQRKSIIRKSGIHS